MKNSDKNICLNSIADFISTFFTALIVMIAALLIIANFVGIHLFNVESGSMAPVYPENSLVVVKETEPANISEGDVITYVMNEAGMVVTHRVVSVDAENRTFKTKGDANNVEDGMPVLWDNMVGKVLFGIPALGSVLSAITAEENRKIMIVIIVCLLISSFGFDIFKKKKRTESNIDEG